MFYRPDGVAAALAYRAYGVVKRWVYCSIAAMLFSLMLTMTPVCAPVYRHMDVITPSAYQYPRLALFFVRVLSYNNRFKVPECLGNLSGIVQ